MSISHVKANITCKFWLIMKKKSEIILLDE